MHIQLLLIIKKIYKKNIAKLNFHKKRSTSIFTYFRSKTSVVYSYRGFEKIDLRSLIKNIIKDFKT